MMHANLLASATYCNQFTSWYAACTRITASKVMASERPRLPTSWPGGGVRPPHTRDHRGNASARLGRLGHGPFDVSAPYVVT